VLSESLQLLLTEDKTTVPPLVLPNVIERLFGSKHVEVHGRVLLQIAGHHRPTTIAGRLKTIFFA
jgi:hypothetical protein